MRMTGARDAVVAARKGKPWWSLQDIAREVGVSRERVRQILVQEGLPTRRYMPKDLIDQALVELRARGAIRVPLDTPRGIESVGPAAIEPKTDGN